MFPVPSTKANETAIATILSDMDAEIAALEAKLAKAAESGGGDYSRPHIHQAKPLVMDLLPAVRVDRCWDAFFADSSGTPP